MADRHPQEGLDVIVLKFEDQKYNLCFPRYAIGRGLVTIEDLREATANRCGTEPGAVALFFDNQELEENLRTARSYRLERNSTISCTTDRGKSDALAQKSNRFARAKSDAIACKNKYSTSFPCTKPKSISGETMPTLNPNRNHDFTDISALDDLGVDAIHSHSSVALDNRKVASTSHTANVTQETEIELELLGNDVVTEGGATFTDCTSIEDYLDQEVVGPALTATLDQDAAFLGFASVGANQHKGGNSYLKAAQLGPLPASDFLSPWWNDTTEVQRQAAHMKINKLKVRFVDIGTFSESGDVRLVTPSKYFDHEYMIFDWGNTDKFELWTTKQNLAQRELGVKSNSFPEEVRTAFTMARAYGVRYVWIPSVCTVCDDEADIKDQDAAAESLLDHAMGMLLLAGGVNHQYLEMIAMQRRYVVLEVPYRNNKLREGRSSPKYILQSYLRSRHDPWTPLARKENKNSFWSELQTWIDVEQSGFLFQKRSESVASEHLLSPALLGSTETIGQAAGHKLSGISSSKPKDTTPATRLKLNDDTWAGSLLIRSKQPQDTLYAAALALQCGNSTTDLQNANFANISADQHANTNYCQAPLVRTQGFLGTEGASDVRADVARETRKDCGCRLRCPWNSVGRNDPICEPHLCKKKKYESVHALKKSHALVHHKSTREAMRLPRRCGATEREKWLKLMMKWVYGWDPKSQRLDDFLNSQQLPIVLPNPYKTDDTEQCIYQYDDHLSSWQLPNEAFRSPWKTPDECTVQATPPMPKHPASRDEDHFMSHKVEAAPPHSEFPNFDSESSLQPEQTSYQSPLFPNYFGMATSLEPIQYFGPTSVVQHAVADTSRTTDSTWLRNDPASPWHEQPIFGDEFLTFDEASLIGPQQRVTHMILGDGFSSSMASSSAQPPNNASDTLVSSRSGEAPLYLCDSTEDYYTGENLDDLAKTTNSLGYKSLGKSSAGQAKADTGPNSLTLTSAADSEASQKGILVADKICTCEDWSHATLKWNRKPFCECCKGFQTYSSGAATFFQNPADSSVCWCNDFNPAGESYAKRFRNDFCTCCSKWKAFSEYGRARLNHLILRIALVKTSD